MLSNFITQWEAANLSAFQLLGKVVVQTTNPGGLAGAAVDAGAWRAWLHTALQTSQHYLKACESALDAGWREQRDRLALTGSGEAVKELAALNADLATRATQGQVEHAGALASATAQYLTDLGRSRNPSDALLAFGRLAVDMQGQSRAHALHLASLAGGVPPALAQWADRHLAGDAAEQTS